MDQDSSKYEYYCCLVVFNTLIVISFCHCFENKTFYFLLPNKVTIFTFLNL